MFGNVVLKNGQGLVMAGVYVWRLLPEFDVEELL